MREEEIYGAILAAINGEDHDCPEPVWRHEEFLKAIHDALVGRLPAPPDTDGTYLLTCTVSGGEPTYSWESAS